MSTVWIGIAILMNACSASYLHILLGNKKIDQQERTHSFMIASLCWYSASLLFILPHIFSFFTVSMNRIILLLLIVIFIFSTAFYHLSRIVQFYPESKKRIPLYLITLFLFGVGYNVFFSIELSRWLLRLSSAAVIVSSLHGVLKHSFYRNDTPIRLGASYVLGGVLLQLSGHMVQPNVPAELVQVMLLASVPLIMYGFGFIALEGYTKVVGDHMNHIESKTCELDAAYEALYQTSHYDQQTGLKNLQHFELDLESIMLSGKPTWAGLINLSDFRRINHTLGYQCGDSVIKSLSEQIHAFLPLDGTLYRMSGDRFAFIYQNASETLTRKLCRMIQHQLKTCSTTHDLPFILTASIGITQVTSDKSIDTIHQELELSMSTASHLQTEQPAFYSQSLLDDFIKENELRENLKSAAKNEDWSIHFQPQIDISNGKICGAEILIRWETEDGRIISPGDFIPLAEKIGLMKNIGITVIDKSFQAVQLMNSKGFSQIRYAINLSGDQFKNKDIIDALYRLKDEYSIPNGQIILEICETVFIEDFETAQMNVQRFKSHGFKVALDDFGTGYSSLQYLSELSVDEIKFDKTFVKDIDTNLKSRKILATMINLAKQLEIRHVIEGVESSSQLRVIETLGGEIYQGFYFSKPVNLDSLERILVIMHNSEYTA